MEFEQYSQMSQTPSVNVDSEFSHVEAERAGSSLAAEASPIAFESPSVSVDLTELSRIEPRYSCSTSAAESPPLIYEQLTSGGVVDPFNPSSNGGTPESLFNPQSAVDFILR